MFTTIIRFFSFFIIISTLISCNLQPVYKDKPNGLAKMKIGQITFSNMPSKMHFIFRKSLEDNLLGVDNRIEAEYLLNINLSDSRQSIVIQSNSISSRNQVNLIANYTLVDILSGKEIISDKVIAIDSFEITSSPYSNQVSEEESLNNLARDIVNDIKFRLMDLLV